MKAQDFVKAVQNGDIDKETIETMINEGNELNGLDLNIMETEDFEQQYATGDLGDLETFAGIVKASDLDLDRNYVRTAIYDYDYTEGDSLDDLLDSDDLEEIFDEWRDNLEDGTTSVEPEELEDVEA